MVKTAPIYDIFPSPTSFTSLIAGDRCRLRHPLLHLAGPVGRAFLFYHGGRLISGGSAKPEERAGKNRAASVIHVLIRGVPFCKRSVCLFFFCGRFLPATRTSVQFV
jgi:hypothetical protein